MDWRIGRPDNGLKGELVVPPDKSISHRAIMFSAISNGECRIKNFLFGGDCMRTFEVFRSMGIEISREEDTVIVKGKGLRGLSEPADVLYLGNSGTTMRIMSGILAGQEFSTVLTGDESLSSRPMDRIIEPLSMMGAEIISEKEDFHAPLKIVERKKPLAPISYVLPMASAQVKSCVLAAGLYADGKTSVTEPFQSRDHTELMLKYFSADIKRDVLTTEINGLKELVSQDLEVPGDISSAAFFIVGALITKDSCLLLRNVGLNPTRIGIINVLRRMSGNIKIVNERDNFEPVGDIEVRHSNLKGTVVGEEEVPLLIDEIPILAVAALTAEGPTFVKGIHELKVKETNRVKSITENFSQMGIHIEEDNDTLIIPGESSKICAAKFDSFGDHRIAMSMAILGLISRGDNIICNTSCVDTSYPGFLTDLESIKK